MGKSSAVSKRRKKTKSVKFVHKTKLKKQRNKILKKSIKIECEPIRKSWDYKKNLKTNISSMGLSLNPNTIPQNNSLKGMTTKSRNKRKTKKDKPKDKTKVIEDLEAIADKPQSKNFRFGPQISKFCVYMIEKYGEDYEAMARDKQNYYQESSGQIRQKIIKFKSIPSNWNSYLKAKDCIDSSDDRI